jgi:hypothetical protein
MNRRTRTLFLLAIFLLIGLSVFPASPALAQDQPPIYFPLFMHYTDPRYASGLDGGTVVNVIVDPSDPDTLYAGTWGNGIYKSTDAGANWIHIVEGLRSPYIYEIAVDPHDSQHLLASVYEQGIDQSFDGGATWSSVSGFVGYFVAYSIDFDPVDSNNVYAAMREETIYDSSGNAVWWPGGVWKSTDGGGAWVDSSSGITEDYIYDLAIDPNDPDTIYTANHKTGVYKTEDGGENWVKRSSGLIHQDIRDIQVNPVNGRVYAGLWDGYGFAYSIDGGNYWISNSWSINNDLYVFDIQSDPKQPDSVYLATSNGAYLCDSPTSGSSCSIMANSGEFVWDLALDINGPTAANGRTMNMYTGIQYFGLYKSADGGVDFDPSYQGIRANVVKSVMVNPVNPDIQFVSAYNRGLFRTLDGGVTWKPLHDVLALEFINDIAARPGSVEAVYIGDSYGGIQFSLDNGNTWVSGNSGLSRSVDDEIITSDVASSGGGIDPDAYGWMDPVDLQDLIDAVGVIPTADRASSADVETIGFDPVDSTKMFAGKNGGGVAYSNNSGVSWSNSNLAYGHVLDSLVDPDLEWKYLIGMQDYGVKVSSDRINWENFGTGLPSGADVYGLALQGTGIYLAGTDQGLYRMDIGDGLTWSKIELDVEVRDIVVDPTNPDMIWAATLEGLYYGLPTGAEGAYEWTNYDLDDSNNDRMYVIEIISVSGSTREFYIGMDGGDINHLIVDLLP